MSLLLAKSMFSDREKSSELLHLRPTQNKGGNSVLQRICRNSHRFNIEIQILVGKVMVVSSIEFIIRPNFLTSNSRYFRKQFFHFPTFNICESNRTYCSIMN
ncbi:hypothetical protein LEP1GSC170_2026 [Leptospira interrogans serovar Bataviae str. HAI135]|nr:hypothetical protein LEP1GSC170_2026 [Leptospira interrogans serovar Bataviae str. HAI135]